MQVVIDERINKIIQEYFLSLGYEIIKVKKNKNVYNEISSHTDIFCIKIDDTVIFQKDAISGNLDNTYVSIYGDKVGSSYPDCAKYNVCINHNYAIHNFKITNKVILDVLKQKNYNLINVKQGYSRCSILPLGNKCLITSDKGIYNELLKYGFDMLFLDPEDLDIKLYKEDNSYSSMSGFIGGCSCIMGDTVVFFGDIDRFKCKDKLVNYIKSKGFNIKDFKNMDVIDYGSCIFLNEGVKK